MRLLKQALGVLGALVVLAVIVELVAPKKARAMQEMLVQITNTGAHPVPTQDSATRFQADICQVSGPVSTAANYCGGNTGGTFEVPTVTSDGAAVKRLIVDNVSGTCSSFNNAALFVKEIRIFGQFVPDSVPNGDTKPAHLVPIVGPAYSYINDPSIGPPLGGIQETDYTFGQTTHFAFNPGDTVTMDYFAFYPGVGAHDVGCLVRIEGFFVNQ